MIKRLPLRARLRRLALGIIRRIRHPTKVTCLECGFLSFGKAEATAEDRVLLGDFNMSPSISLDNLYCFRSLWLGSVYGRGDEAIIDEIAADRRGCTGFDRHRPGFTPSEHLDLLSKRWEARRQFWFTVLGSATGAALALLVAWLTWRWGIK